MDRYVSSSSQREERGVVKVLGLTDSHIAIVLLDRGQTLSPKEERLPWQMQRAHEARSLLPAIDYGREDPYKSMRHWSEEYIHLSSPEESHPYHPWTDCQRAPSQTLLTSDPFFLLGKLYDSAGLSIGQLLNFLEEDIQTHLDQALGDLANAASQLRYNLTLLQRLQGFIQSNKYTIDQRGSAAWPQCDQEAFPKEYEAMIDLQQTLQKDYEALSRRFKDLARRCEVGSQNLQNQIAINEARQARKQARAVGQLTKLASAFVPLSFVAAVYGMNVKEINSDNPPLWSFVLISAVVLMATYLL